MLLGERVSRAARTRRIGCSQAAYTAPSTASEWAQYAGALPQRQGSPAEGDDHQRQREQAESGQPPLLQRMINRAQVRSIHPFIALLEERLDLPDPEIALIGFARQLPGFLIDPILGVD